MSNVVRIVHVSDLHFGIKNAEENWTSLTKWLQNAIDPQLVLVSGDVVDDPKKATFERAKELLDKLEAGRAATCNYLVCAGNHDRHPRGNALGFRGWLGDWWSNAAAWFDQRFADRLATSGSPRVFDFPGASNRWNIAVVGLETSMLAQYSAQGYADAAELERLRNTLEQIKDADLVIALCHHRLLPMLELEQQRQQAKQLLVPTVMLNPGTTLRRLAEGNVDLVLHGHEHEHSVACFGSLGADRHDMVVLAAGSATGARTLNGAELSRAAANLIELCPDRTVRLRTIANRGSQWQLGSETQAVTLLERRQLGRSRFLRSTNPGNRPTSVIQRYFEFQPNRDILINETNTNWSIDQGIWSRRIINSSGIPTPAKVRFEWPSNPAVQEHDCIPVVSDVGDHTYRYEVDLGTRERMIAKSVAWNYRWIGGGILTKDDIALISSTSRGDFRRDGYEFAGIHVDGHVEAVTLTVRLPAAFAPSDGVSVCRQANGLAPEKDAILSDLVQHQSAGAFSLEIRYPIKGAGYALCWKPINGAGVGRTARQFQLEARDGPKAECLLAAFDCAAMAAVPSFGRLSAALYVPIEDEPWQLRRAASRLPQGTSVDELPANVSLRAGETLYRHAWYGEPRAGYRVHDDDGHRHGLLPNEHALVILPVVPPGKSLDSPWGLVRVGIPTGANLSEDDLPRVLDTHIFAYAVASLLNAFERSKT